MDKLLEKIVEIIKGNNGWCSIKDLVNKIQENDPDITLNDINYCITANPTLLKRTPKEELCGIIIKEAGVSLTGGVVPLPKSTNKNEVKNLPKKVVVLPKDQSKRRKKK